MQKIGEGAEAVIYEKRLFGLQTIVKTRKPKHYRIKTVDVHIRRQRTRKEAKLMSKAAKIGISMPKVLAVGDFSIIMERVNGKSLKDTGVSARQARLSAEIIARLHSANISHGDFTPANLIASGDFLCLIDFGLSDETNSMEDKAIDILLMKRQLSNDIYSEFAKRYSRAYRHGNSVLRRLAAIEKRGRYQSRTLA